MLPPMKLRRVLLVGVLAACAVTAALGGRALWQQHQRTEVLRHTQTVVTAVRELARLEAAEYHLERVIDLRDQQVRLYGLLQGEDALLLVAAGDVVAGVDLSRLLPGDVVVDAAGTARVRLPAPEIFHVRLDEAHTYVHSRRTDLVAQRDEALEARARQLALQSFEQAARESGILERARAQCERLVRALLRQLGAQAVVVTFAAARPG